jgi:hypothetical protein
MFSGLRHNGHAVRYLNELCNIIRTGKISLSCTDLPEKTTRKVDFKIWQKDIFTSKDLFDYIQQDSIHQCFFNAMLPKEIEVQIKNTSVVQMTYALNLEKFGQELESKFEFTYS